MMARRLDPRDYTVAWIAPLAIEAEAAIGVLDKRHDGYFEVQRHDDFLFIPGQINKHNIVIATLPIGQNYGVGSAAALANQLKHRFHNLWFALLVGVAAGLPNLASTNPQRRRDIRLGDVLVCVPNQSYAGIVQYDLGRDTGDGFVPNSRQAETPTIVRAAYTLIQQTDTVPYRDGHTLAQLLRELQSKFDHGKFRCPDQGLDVLYANSSNDFGVALPVQRTNRDETERTRVWYGSLGSGNSLMRNSARRDELRNKFDLVGLEMEAAGVMNTLPTGVIRGVCDYGDEHKNKEWQPYAAAVAAVYAKAVLFHINVMPSKLPATQEEDIPQTDVRDKTSDSATSKHQGGSEVDTAFNMGVHLDGAPVIDSGLFVGRAAELDAMKTALQPGNQLHDQRCVVLGGPGGIGKTQLALSYVKKHSRSYSSVFWINAVSETTVKASLRGVAEVILTPNEISASDADQILLHIRRWLSNPRNPQWLLVFDNYDEPDLFEISRFYPQTQHGTIIVTTRLPSLVSGRHIKVSHLENVNESLQILETRSQRLNTRSDPFALRLAERLHGYPLALATAGAFLRRSVFSFEKYLFEYEHYWRMDERRPQKLLEYKDRTLYTTWNFSFEKLESDDPDAAALLKLLAYFDNQRIWYQLICPQTDMDRPEWLCMASLDQSVFESMMGTLVEYCFLEPHSTDGFYSMHACVHDWVLIGLNQTPEEWAYVYAAGCVDAFIQHQDEKFFSHVKFAPLIPHIIRLTHPWFNSALLPLTATANFMNKMKNVLLILQGHGRPVEAQILAENLCAIQTSRKGENDIKSLEWFDLLGKCYHILYRLDDAEGMYKKVLSGYKKILPQTDRRNVNALRRLGILYRDKRMLEQSLSMFSQALESSKRYLGPDDALTCTVQFNLGLTYVRLGKFDEATFAFTQALEGREKVFGPTHPDTLNALFFRATLYKWNFDIAAAELSFLEILAGYRNHFGEDGFRTAEVKVELAILYLEQNRLGEAEELASSALHVYADVSGVESYYSYALQKALCIGVRTPGVLSSLSLSRLRSLVERVCLISGTRYSAITRLARALLYYDDEENAQQLYRFYVGAEKLRLSSDCKCCDGCFTNISPLSGLNICRHCFNTDLCDSCRFVNLWSGLTEGMCVNHTFLAVDLSDLNVESKDGKVVYPDIQSLLKPIVEKYGFDKTYDSETQAVLR